MNGNAAPTRSDRPVTTCLLGGSGFVGTRLAGRLAALGYELVIPTRNPARRRHLLVLPSARVIHADINQPAALAAAIAGCSVVINLVGILNERGRDGAGFEAAHAGLTGKIVTACERGKVAKLIQLSALRADAANGPSHYLRSKGRAETAVRGSAGLRWTILQPSVIFGPGDAFANRFGRLLSRIPLLFPLAMPGARFAPVHVEDVVDAIVRAMELPASDGRTYQLCGPEVLTLREIVQRIARELGRRRVVLGLPQWVSRLQARILDYAPGKPFSTDNYQSLTVDSVCSEDGMAALGIRPRSFQANLAAALSTSGLNLTRHDTARRGAGRQPS